jgi:selenide,water dikinase
VSASKSSEGVRAQLGAYRTEVVTGVGDDAALLKSPIDSKELLVQTIDYFRSFVSDPYLFGKIAANHALSDLHAMNGSPVSALALCVLPYGKEDKVENDLVQMIAGAAAVLKEEGCALVGGHSSEGAETAMGLSVHGTVRPERAFRKGPLRVGDSIIATKAIGTGVIMAADMRGECKGSWAREAFVSMLLSNRKAAAILERFGCTACTDITGFGLIGHLLEMLQYDQGSDLCQLISPAHKIVAELYVNSIPVIPGAIECLAKGIKSSLQIQVLYFIPARFCMWDKYLILIIEYSLLEGYWKLGGRLELRCIPNTFRPTGT